MKILFLIRSLDTGGAEQQLVLLAAGLRRRGHEVKVAAFYPGGAFAAALSAAGIQVISLGKRGRWDVAGFIARFIRIARAERPDVLHGYLPTANLVSVIAKPFLRGSRVVWGIRSSIVAAAHYGWLLALEQRFEVWMARFADAIIVNSRAGFEFHRRRGFPERRMTVIPNGFDTARFCPDARQRASVRAQWGIAGHHRLIGLVGRFDPLKDHPTFLRAAARLAAEAPDVRFACVGDGPPRYAAELRQLAAQLGLRERLLWTGLRADMPAVCNALDVACSSSISEGFSNTIGEAMACGVPCAVTGVGDSAWIVGDTGAVAPPGDAAALALALKRCLERPRGDPRRRILENFSEASLTARTEELLAALVR